MEEAEWLLGERDEVPHALCIRKSILKMTQTWGKTLFTSMDLNKLGVTEQGSDRDLLCRKSK